MKTETVTITGYSDDLIEVRGNVRGCDEYSGWNGPGFVEFDSGDVFRIEYTKGGMWKIKHHVQAEGSKLRVEIAECPEGDDPEPYTDTATVKGPISWVDFWDTWPPSLDEVKGKVTTRLEDGITAEQARDIFVALNGPRNWSLAK
ncbi:MAG: hypothetical protein U0791_23360 [Gemmataceae bacterium]